MDENDALNCVKLMDDSIVKDTLKKATEEAIEQGVNNFQLCFQFMKSLVITLFYHHLGIWCALDCCSHSKRSRSVLRIRSFPLDCYGDE